MKYIPEYYCITKDEYTQSCKLEHKTSDPETLRDIPNVHMDCEAYKQEVEEAIQKAFDKYILKHMHKQIVYSKTWGS